MGFKINLVSILLEFNLSWSLRLYQLVKSTRYAYLSWDGVCYICPCEGDNNIHSNTTYSLFYSISMLCLHNV